MAKRYTLHFKGTHLGELSLMIAIVAPMVIGVVTLPNFLLPTDWRYLSREAISVLHDIGIVPCAVLGWWWIVVQASGFRVSSRREP